MANDKPVKYFRLDPQAYRQALHALSQLPYRQVAEPLDNLTKGATAVFDEPLVDQAEIVDRDGADDADANYPVEKAAEEVAQ